MATQRNLNLTWMCSFYINVLFHQPLFLTISTDFCTLTEANKVLEHHDKTIALMNNSSD